MCGICGILDFEGAPIERSLLERMAKVQEHRGPDDEGYFSGAGIGLGFRRLSIIDLSGGRQPMGNEDGTVQVVFNGEIYNFRELRGELESLGHRFRTRSDTEVLVHGYEQWGDGLVERLNGMFGFAVWDGRHRRLLLARDHLGIKPVHYWRAGSRFAFASEIKSLLQLPEFDPAVSDRAVYDYFSYLCVPDPLTIYRDVRRLLPGELLVAEGGEVKTRRYWFPSWRPAEDRSDAELQEELRERIAKAVDMQMIADVPLGVFLSGGLDSSAITAAMRKAGGGEILSFSAGFDVRKYDETEYAERMSHYCRTTHRAFRLTASCVDLLPKLLWHLDEPMADATIIPTYLLSKLTRDHVTVALSGEGGDEIFAGYTQYVGMQLNRRLSLAPRFLRSIFALALGVFPSFGVPRLGYFLHRAQGILRSSLYPPFEDYTRKVAICHPEDVCKLFTPDFQAACSGYRHFAPTWEVAATAPGLDPIGQAALADLTVFMPSALLVKTDRMSMACSLEVRVPLLDRTLVDFAMSIPMSRKIKGLRTKHLMREALAPWLPGDILGRKKRGFNPPLEFWLQKHLVDFAADFRMRETLAETGYIDVAHVDRLIASHVSGRRNFSRQLWALLVFAAWWRLVRGKREVY